MPSVSAVVSVEMNRRYCVRDFGIKMETPTKLVSKSLRGVVVEVICCNIVVSEFKHQSR